MMWISECCDAEPHTMFEISGDAYIGIAGVCSNCKDNAGFRQYFEDYNEDMYGR